MGNVIAGGGLGTISYFHWESLLGLLICQTLSALGSRERGLAAAALKYFSGELQFLHLLLASPVLPASFAARARQSHREWATEMVPAPCPAKSVSPFLPQEVGAETTPHNLHCEGKTALCPWSWASSKGVESRRHRPFLLPLAFSA